MQEHPAEERLGHRNLIGLVGDRDLDQDFPALVGGDGQQVRRRLLAAPGTPQHFPVERHRFRIRSGSSSLDPVR